MNKTKTEKNEVAYLSESKKEITFSEYGLVFIDTNVKFIKDSLFLALRGKKDYFSKRIFINDDEITFKEVDKFAVNNISYINIRKSFRNNKNIMWHINLSLKLKGNEIEIEEIRRLAKNNNVYEYLESFPHELSKFELMRILIFLAVVNKDKIILIESAYERFENNETEELIDILKNLAKEKLIICVNFTNRSFLENQDCNPIEILTTSINKVKLTGKTYKFEKNEKNIPFKKYFSYYNKGIFAKAMIFLANLSIIILFSVFIIFENKKSNYFNFLKYFDLKYAVVDKNNENEKLLPVYSIFFHEINSNANIIEVDDFKSEEFDLLFGNEAKNFNEIVVSDLFAEEIRVFGKLNSIQEIIGFETKCKIQDEIISIKISGIYETKKDLGKSYQLVKRGFTINYLNEIDFDFVINGKKAFNYDELKIGEMLPRGKNYSAIIDNRNLRILLEDGKKSIIKDLKLEEDEIILNINHFNALFYHENNIKKIEEISGFEDLNIKVGMNFGKEFISEIKNFKIKGIIYDINNDSFDENYENSDVLNLIFSDKLFDEIFKKYYYKHYVYNFNNKNPSKFFKDNWKVGELKNENTEFIITTAYDGTISFYYESHKKDILSNFWWLIFGIPLIFVFKMSLNNRFLRKNNEYFSSLLSAGEREKNLTNGLIFIKFFESILILAITIILVAPIYKIINDTDEHLKKFLILNFRNIIDIILFTAFVIGISLVIKLKNFERYIEKN